MRPTKSAVLFDASGSANAAFDTGNLDTSDYDAILVEVIPSAAAAASTLSFYDTAFSTSTAVYTVATGATAAVKTSGWGTIAPDATVGERLAGLPAALPASVRIGIGALGAGVSARIRVVGRRFFKGVEGDGVGVASSYRDPVTGTTTHTEV